MPSYALSGAGTKRWWFSVWHAVGPSRKRNEMNLTRHETEIEGFQNLWHRGYLEGDPLDPMAPSGYGPFGYLSSLHATYLCCIKPYVTSDTRVLEIGPGRGGWTKCFVERRAKEVWALDALSAEKNGFWEYVGHHQSV